MRRSSFVWLAILWLGISSGAAVAASGQVGIRLDGDVSARVRFGAEHLTEALRRAGYEPARISEGETPAPLVTVAVEPQKERSEGFRLLREKNGLYRVTGFGDSGALYGCLELSRRVTAARALPTELDVTDGPAFRLRGVCVAMQLTSILPGRDTYEYPYTPENFPFFYDKAQWIQYLDFLVQNRFNTLYLWNGHPFASLVKLEQYPYALEVSEEVYQRNVQMYRFLTEEADRRGIWVVQMFYNIFVSRPFADHHGIKTQHRGPTDLVADYNRRSIAKFVEMYPNVGLLVCLGEALVGQENQEKWMHDTVIEGVKDAMRRLNMTEEPPIVVRAHSVSDAKALMESALQHYQNLYTMAKYNGESLTTYEPRGQGQQVHLDLSRAGSAHVVNVHLLSNLEPFRYGATEFIRKSVLACRDRLGAQGLHLYPLAYWDWPNTPDNVMPFQRQYQRDWIWFEAWARYLWQPDRDSKQDHQYWVRRLTETFGNEQAAELILSAYNDAGHCAPMLLRRFGITEGNRQTFSLGMFLDQLVNPGPYKPFAGLWEWQAPPGERLAEYAKNEWLGVRHEGETPVSVITDASRFAAQAVAAIEKATPRVMRNRAEFERLRNDVHCIQLVSENYAEKVRAAMLVLRYGYSRDKKDMQKAAAHLAKSVEIYRALTDRTAGTYRYANTLQTAHRRIPIRGWKDDQPYYYHWEHMLPLYEAELAQFQEQVAGIGSQVVPEVKPWQVFEVEMTAARKTENPYVAYLQEGHPARVTVRFRGVSGEAAGRELTLAGFWDGGTTWKARFAPPASGEWAFESRSEDSGLNGVAGKLTCTAWTENEKKTNPARRGFVRVHLDGRRAGRYFEYADGTPFLWIGDTWWNWTQRGIHFETFQKLVEDRAKKGFNVGQLFFPANGWGQRSSLLDADYDEPDLEHIRRIEQWIAYANERGITVWIHPWWSRARLNETAGPEKIRRWWRYVIHRLAAYNVIWTLAGEYNMNNYGGLGLEFWKDLGAMIAAEDPFDHLLSAHPTPPAWDGGAEAPQWSTAEVLHREPWLDYNQSQTAHARWRNEYAPTVVAQAYAMNPPKPIVITEPWYEFALDAPAAREIRFCAWSALMSGAAGHTYGGGHVWLGYLPEVSRPGRGGGTWPLDPDFKTNTLDYPGARAMAHLAGILRSVEWWRLEPHPELVLENPSRYCLAVPGELYVLFLRWGGAVKLDLTAYPDATFARQWIDLVTEKPHASQELAGGRAHVIHAPEDFPAVRQEKDWILIVKNTRKR